MNNNKMPFLTGNVILKSDLSLEELAQILSAKLFGGLQFGGKDEYIHEEVPAIFVNQVIMGLAFVLSGYGGFDRGFTLSAYTGPSYMAVGSEKVSLDDYLLRLCKTELAEYPNIIIE